jgi:hypothetical protein
LHSADLVCLSVNGTTLDPEVLLAGPRGRRVCWELLTRTSGWTFEEPPESAGVSALAGALSTAVARSDFGALAVASEPASFLAALADAVTFAMYWQEPDDRDRRLADERIADVLCPVAEAVSRAPAAAWWSATLNHAAQHEVVFHDPDEPSIPDPPEDARAALAAWREATLADERRAADRPQDVRANYSGYWWSTPAHSGLRRSTRSLGTVGPVGLHLVEDALGWTSARCWALELPHDAVVYEIHTPEDWGELVARYPLSVTKARRHDWWRATGEENAWAVPDYPAVAADYDAIHLSVGGYLSTAGRAIASEGAHTVLAGWDPDQTWWLTDSPRRLGEPVTWLDTREQEPFMWAPTQ